MSEEQDIQEPPPLPERRPARGLTYRMLLALALGLGAIFLTELGIRAWIELPDLYAIERSNDGRSIERLRSAIQRRIEDLGHTLVDYSAWDATYDFMARDAAAPAQAYFIQSDLGTATYRNNQINGIVLFDLEDRVVHSGNVDLTSGAASARLSLDPASLETRIAAPSEWRRGTTLIEAGISPSNLGYLLFAVGWIVDTSETRPPRGRMLVWRLLDRDEQLSLAQLTSQEFLLLPANSADARSAAMLARLADGTLEFLPRDADDMLHWRLDDVSGRPAFLVRQHAEARNFDARLLSPSSAAGFVSSGIVLLLVTLYFSRGVVQRVIRGTDIMRRIRQTGAFHHRVPVGTREHDELSEMFQHFNALLARVQSQENDLREQNRKLSEMSQQDTLTGIPNRRALNENFDRYWRQAARAHRPISALMIDVDYFKAFNDRYGHQAGDRVLKQVAQSLLENLHRATDFIARYGGEEFCVILTETALSDAARVADGLRRAVMDLGIRHELSPHNGLVTISVGVASVVADHSAVHLDLVREADRALYRAKELGRNRVFHFEDDATAPATRPGEPAAPD